MKRITFISSILFSLLIGCEDIYNPDIELREGVLVVDARIVTGEDDNIIKVYKSLGFNEKGSGYPEVVGAKVCLIDEEENQHDLWEIANGSFLLNFELESNRRYKLKVEYQDDVYESAFEAVPALPVLDTVYGFAEDKILQIGGTNNVNDFLERPGVMLYTDIANDTIDRYFRFKARKTYQYVFYIPDPLFGELVVFGWGTFTSLEGGFNVAAPAGYSTSKSISKHPLYFMEKEIGGGRELEHWGRTGFGETFLGWILHLDQYSISKNTYSFYKDLNRQLEAEGRLFDPLYVQARNNLTCTTKPDKLILGNFEISAYKEYRFYVRFISEEDGYQVKPIPYFYDIPPEGRTVEEQPDFWETPSKKYPNE